MAQSHSGTCAQRGSGRPPAAPAQRAVNLPGGQRDVLRTLDGAKAARDGSGAPRAPVGARLRRLEVAARQACGAQARRRARAASRPRLPDMGRACAPHSDAQRRGRAEGPRAPPELGAPGLSAARERPEPPRRLGARLSQRPEKRVSPLVRLHGCLRRLTPEARRSVIEQLTGEQRIALERWMLHARPPGPARGTEWLARGEVPGPGKRPPTRERTGCVHLGRHLYAHAHPQSLEVEALLALRAAWRLGEEGEAGDRDFERLVAASLGAISAAAHGAALRFRTRISFGRGLRLSSPLRQDLSSALCDWRRLRRAWGRAHFHGGALRASCTPESAEEQWGRTCRAWRDVWAENGGLLPELNRSLREAEEMRRPVWAKAMDRWRRARDRQMQQLRALLKTEI